MSLDNIISFPTVSAQESKVELPADVEAEADVVAMPLPPPPIPDPVEQRRVQVLHYLNEFLNNNFDRIDSFMFIAKVRRHQENQLTPAIINSPMTPETESFFVNSLTTQHHQRLLGLWGT